MLVALACFLALAFAMAAATFSCFICSAVFSVAMSVGLSATSFDSAFSFALACFLAFARAIAAATLSLGSSVACSVFPSTWLCFLAFALANAAAILSFAESSLAIAFRRRSAAS